MNGGPEYQWFKKKTRPFKDLPEPPWPLTGSTDTWATRSSMSFRHVCTVGYGCLLCLHFVLGGECFRRADSHEKGSLLHRQVSGFFKVARYWLPDHWQDWVGSSIFSKQKKHQHWKDRSCMVMANGHTIRKIDNQMELRIGDQLPTTIGLWTMQKMPLKQCARIPQSGFHKQEKFVGFFSNGSNNL